MINTILKSLLYLQRKIVQSHQQPDGRSADSDCTLSDDAGIECCGIANKINIGFKR